MREQGRTVWDGDAVHTRTPTAIKLPKKETLWKQVEEVGGKKKKSEQRNQRSERRKCRKMDAITPSGQQPRMPLQLLKQMAQKL